jgi:CRISPR-associated protein Cas2
MFILVTYDISSPRRLARVARLMKNYGGRVQKSVFECDINDNLYVEMKRKIEKVIDLERDSVRYYFFCEKCRERIEISGKGVYTEIEDVMIV